MSVRRVQNRVRKRYGIGKAALQKRMSITRRNLKTLAYNAQWPGGWGRKLWDEEQHQEMHTLVDKLAADAIITMAYREAEDAERKAMKAREVTVYWHIPPDKESQEEGE